MVGLRTNLVDRGVEALEPYKIYFYFALTFFTYNSGIQWALKVTYYNLSDLM